MSDESSYDTSFSNPAKNLAKKPVASLFPDMVARAALGQCTTCGKPVHPENFRDAISRKEYTISGMCQKCQDSVFGDGS